MRTFQTILIEGDALTPIVKLNRPDKLNAINLLMIEELTAAFTDFGEAFARACAPRAVILIGAGEKAFVAGADLAHMNGMGSDAATRFSETGHRLGQLMERSPFPVIAAVNGFALGGGLELALCADFMLASERARFGLPEVTLGLIPGFGGTERLARRVSLGLAREMVFSGRNLNASEAFAAGLVNAVVAPESLLERALEAAGRVRVAAPLAVAKAKELLNADLEGHHAAAFAREARAFGGLFQTADAQEGMSAFSEKRVPAFTGT
ncbi:MAG: enoyl-CoA hydratase-related protein [Polyangiaceae bacterium]|nr:enoyl-CoA hydratase-related protein [Polyangiaceae bacterium]